MCVCRIFKKDDNKFEQIQLMDYLYFHPITQSLKIGHTLIAIFKNHVIHTTVWITDYKFISQVQSEGILIESGEFKKNSKPMPFLSSHYHSSKMEICIF